MSLILHLETATRNCSVSLAEDGVLIGTAEWAGERYVHGERLHVFIKELVDAHGLALCDLSAVAVSKGPGSYTGLRIGVAAAKGLCYALDMPLIAIHTLTVLARAARDISDPRALIIPMLDARRAEVYTRVYDLDFTARTETKAVVLRPDSFSEFHQPLYFLGDGVAKASEVIQMPNARFLDIPYPSAKHMVALAYDEFVNASFADLAYFEPYYLKDFIAIPPKCSV
ncbi:MAG: tRNA (adenosine(37)-N6)-threonylcarbamoyltransferase complex dimerization subunit type 1 TsaB [Flavobacteriales bacterium]